MTSAQKLIAVGALVITGAWLLKRRGGTVSTWETFDLEAFGVTVDYPQPLKDFAAAIARAEGYGVPGAIPTQTNNPGDLKLPGSAYTTASGITVFSTAAEGWNALYRQLLLIVRGDSAHYSLDMTIGQMARKWVGDSDAPNWARNVASRLGVSVDTPLWEVII